MMDMCKNIAMMAVAALLWCCNGDDTLLDRYPMEPIVNPEVGVLIDGNRIIHADFDGRQQISGVTEHGIFTTTSRFQSFGFEPHAWQASEGVLAFGDGVIAHVQSDSLSFSLRYSTDNGKTWASYGGAVVDERFLVAGGVEVAQLSIASDGSVWVLGQQELGKDKRALLYRVDLEGQRSTLMLEKVGATALAFGLADSEHGWVLYGEGGDGADRVVVSRTENGGRSWAVGAVLRGMEQPAVAAITNDNLMVYSREGAVFRSTDGGISFESVEVGAGITVCQAVSPSVVYALLVNGVAKSIDGGQTWAVMDMLVHGVEVSGTAMDFHSERAGIVYSADRLFITSNGGQSWDILVYPYDYVFE